MVFFNHSTMQMAAKIVYYGPGLCGKTTNLQHIYGHTSREARGEMVSLETDTDRTLFFDLLPIDVGTIQGFSTRIQLYTVPGQVFYNTTRKLVLKGVDGVVFVADSQRPMLSANVDSFSNLEDNLAEIGLSADEMPLVLQYNKRDLRDICGVEELDKALNRGGWPAFEAAAIHGQGVFETLKAISKLTLLALKRRISQGGARPPAKAAAPRPATPNATPPARPAVVAPTATPAPRPRAAVEPIAAPAPQAPPAAAQPQRTPGPPASTSPPQQVAAPAKPGPGPERARGLDILAELEKIRSQGVSGLASRPVTALNGSRRIDDRLRFEMDRARLRQARRVSLHLRVEDGEERVLETFLGGWDLDDPETLEQLRLRLEIALQSRD